MTTWWMLIKIIMLYFLLFYIVPLSIQSWKVKEGGKDRFFISIIHSHVFFILVIHVLVIFNIYETFSLMFVCIIAYIFILRRRKKTDSLSPFMKIVLSIMEATEQENGWRKWREEAFYHVSTRFTSLKQSITTKVSRHPVSLSLVVALFGVSAYIRFKHSIQHLYFGAADPYVHLKWAKLVRANELYPDGVYPFGFEMIISALNTIFQLDPYFILRFLGPLSGVLLVFSLYFVSRNHFRHSYSVAIFALVIYFISSFHFEFIWRQYSSLSMEYGMIFILPGIYFFHRYLQERNKTSLLVSMECFLLTIFIHPYAAICLLISLIVLFLYSWKRLSFVQLFRLVGGFAVVGVIGILPLMIGILTGKEFHGESIRFVQESIKTNSFQDSILSTFSKLGGNLFIMIFLVTFLVSVVLRLWRKGKMGQPFQLYTIISFVFFLLYRADLLGLPTIMLPYRIEVFLVMVMSVSIASVLALVPDGKWRRVTNMCIITGCILLMSSTIPVMALPKGSSLQYDEAVEAYLKVKKEFPVQEWTIISSVEEYPLTINYGWHYDLADFIRGLTEGTEIKFATKDIFLYVEKVPFGSVDAVSTNSVEELSLPEVEEDLDFYRDSKYRTLLQEQTWYFIEQMQQKHPGLLELFVDSPRFKVYHIKQDPLKPFNFTALMEG